MALKGSQWKGVGPQAAGVSLSSRLPVAVVLAAVMLGAAWADRLPAGSPLVPAHWIALAYLAFAAALLGGRLWRGWHRGESTGLERAGLIGDAVILSAGLAVAGPWAGGFFAVLLWRMVEAAARRETWPWLGAAAAVAGAAMFWAWIQSPFWSTQGPLAAALVAAVLLVPLSLRWRLGRETTGTDTGAVDPVGRRLSGLAHDLRAPLNTILGYSQMLREDAEAGGLRQAAEDLARVEAAGRRLLHMINSMVELARLESGTVQLQSQWFSLRQLMERVQENTAPAGRVQVPPEIACEGGDIEIHGDHLKLAHVLETAICLCHEAGGGPCSLEYRYAPGDGTRVEFVLRPGSAPASGGERIRGNPFDAGSATGTPMEAVDREVAARLLELMGGRGTLRPEKGGPGCIVISVPVRAVRQPGPGVPGLRVVEEPVSAGAAPGPARSASGPASPTVLIIDDDPAVRDLLGRHLVRAGFAVEFAGTGELGLEQARRHPPDVVILDMLMPGMDGWSVLRELGRDTALSRVPVIVSTMLDAQELGQALGAVRYLRKPLDSAMVVEAVRESLGRRGTTA